MLFIVICTGIVATIGTPTTNANLKKLKVYFKLLCYAVILGLPAQV